MGMEKGFRSTLEFWARSGRIEEIYEALDVMITELKRRGVKLIVKHEGPSGQKNATPANQEPIFGEQKSE